MPVLSPSLVLVVDNWVEGGPFFLKVFSIWLHASDLDGYLYKLGWLDKLRVSFLIHLGFFYLSL